MTLGVLLTLCTDLLSIVAVCIEPGVEIGMLHFPAVTAVLIYTVGHYALVRQKVNIFAVTGSTRSKYMLADDAMNDRLRTYLHKDERAQATTLRRLVAKADVHGVSRRLGEDSGAWRAKVQDTPWIRLDLPTRAALKTLQITLDSNFDLEKKITLSSRRQNQQVPGIPKELIRDYDVELLLGNEIVAKEEIRGNFQRLNRIDLRGTTCDAVRIKVLATNGDEYARIFEIRLYED